ncbi:replication initiation protein [Psychrobacter immobilis]|uniref:replication initiation protein n=1 Tax=Psychrobacter immobilis TaxID=498 RepID=UPI003FCFE055
MANDLVVMHNDIVTSAYNLSVNEQRLIYCALKQIPKEEPLDPNTPFYISRDDFIELGASPINVARDIRQATKDLMKKTIYVSTDTGILEFHWLSEVLRYDKNAEKKLKEKYPDPKDYKKYINSLRLYNLLDSLPNRTDDIVARITFHEKVVPLLSDLKASFTQFLIKDVADFSSIYSYRIYQLMMRYKSTSYVKISLDDLRFMLMLMDKYPLTADLKRWVIDTAVDEINEKSPYSVKYKLVKKGRKYTHLELNFKRKEEPKNTIKDVARDANTADMFTVDGLSDKQLGRIARNQQFIADYNHLVSSTSPAGQNSQAWEFEMINRLKRDPSQFNKRPIRDYLDC